jgi:Uma2 family endonuclease
MSERAPSRMTTDEFIAWAMNRPEGGKYELYHGEIIQMAPERTLHSETKFLLGHRLLAAIETQRLPCQVFGDSMTVEIEQHTAYEPDVLVRCGPRLPPDTMKVIDPLIVVEVLSPSTQRRDLTEKLSDYFRLDSVRHYLVVDAPRRTVIHHERMASGTIVTHTRIDQPVRLDPPGIEIADFFLAE